MDVIKYSLTTRSTSARSGSFNSNRLAQKAAAAAEGSEEREFIFSSLCWDACFGM
jgi:hypothetical protein